MPVKSSPPSLEDSHSALSSEKFTSDIETIDSLNLQTWKHNITEFVLTKRGDHKQLRFYLQCFHFWSRGRQTFSIKGQKINVLGFAGQKVSVATVPLCLCSSKAQKHARSRVTIMDCNFSFCMLWDVSQFSTHESNVREKTSMHEYKCVKSKWPWVLKDTPKQSDEFWPKWSFIKESQSKSQ